MLCTSRSSTAIRLEFLAPKVLFVHYSCFVLATMELDDADADFDSLWDAELHRASEEVQLLPQGERQWDVLLSKFKKSKVKVSLETIKVMPDHSCCQFQPIF